MGNLAKLTRKQRLIARRRNVLKIRKILANIKRKRMRLKRCSTKWPGNLDPNDIYCLFSFNMDIKEIFSKLDVDYVKDYGEVFILMIGNISGTCRSQITVIISEKISKNCLDLLLSVNAITQPVQYYFNDDVRGVYETWLYSVHLPSHSSVLLIPEDLYPEDPLKYPITMQKYPLDYVNQKGAIGEFKLLYQRLILEDLKLFCDSPQDIIKYTHKFTIKESFRFLHKAWLTMKFDCLSEMIINQQTVNLLELEIVNIKEVFHLEKIEELELKHSPPVEAPQPEQIVKCLELVNQWTETQPIHFLVPLLLRDLMIFAKQVTTYIIPVVFKCSSKRSVPGY